MKKILCIILLVINMLYGVEEWRKITSLQADFKQQIKGEKGAIPVLYSGTLYAANNKVKWLYNKPLAKEVYLEKNVAYVYEPQLNQVTIGSLKENIDFIHILQKVKKISENHYQTKIGDTTYYLTIKDSKPYSLAYEDNLDNDITIIFENVKLNAKIDATTFIFQPPDNVEYIDADR